MNNLHPVPFKVPILKIIYKKKNNRRKIAKMRRKNQVGAVSWSIFKQVVA
jgi:hypothetical protein